MSEFTEWTADDAARHIAVPGEYDDKYSRGVLGVITGSATYPGAAVLGVEAALRTGVGMVRYLGPGRPTRLVLSRRPEAVSSNGRVQAWLIGSGMDHDALEPASSLLIADAASQVVPTILDGGALGLREGVAGPVLLTPHHRELARLLGADVTDVASDPSTWAGRAAGELNATVLLKGHTTWIASPGGAHLRCRAAPTWLATAGAGDALGGIIGALVATHSDAVLADESLLAGLAATATVIHGLAAHRASAGGPFTILDLTEAIPATIVELLRRGNG